MAGRRAAVLGSPIAHSLSPVMHRAAYARYGLDWQYERHECVEAGLAAFVAGLGPEWVGLSLTMPLKEVAFDIATQVDPLAADVGAINTLARRGEGWFGTNTDVAGIRAALAREGVTTPRRVLVLGSGATVRSAMRAVADLGAGHVTFAVRADVRPETAEYAERLGMTHAAASFADVPEIVGDHDLVVDTLPGGAADPVAESLAGADGLPALFEVIYEGWPTRLAQVFAAAGAPVASGLVMLAEQAAEQARLWSGEPLDGAGEVMLAAAVTELARA